MSDVTRVTEKPGTVVRIGRRVGVVLDTALTGDALRVVCSGGVELWPLSEVRPSTATDTATAYLVRALDQAKGAEQMATTALTEYEDRFTQRKRQITKIAHREGPGHGMSAGLDRLLERNGLDPRPTKMVRFVAARIRFEYAGTSVSLSDSGRNPLYSDRYSVTGRFIPAIVVERVVAVQMEEAIISFQSIDRCTCAAEENPDLPTREQVEKRIRQQMAWDHWNWEILDHKMLYVTTAGATNCAHAAANAQAGRRITDVFPEAVPLARPIEAEPEPDIKVGDVVEITEEHDGMDVGWRFTVVSAADDEGQMVGTSPEHTMYEGVPISQWSIEREYCKRVSPRAGERVVLVRDSLGLRRGVRLTVVAPPWESPAGPRLSGTRLDMPDHFVYTVDAADVRLDPDEDSPF